VAPTDATVLIQGESGTGKELVADAIHRHSHLSDRPYLKINCGALSESLLESEIFGHEKGSFTGALAQRKGLFEMAHGGTLYLDEINSIPQTLQVKLLRVLQKQPFFRVGGDRPVSVDVRIIASSNKDIRAEVETGNFREDLYYRLNVVSFHIPPLRERISDIELLAKHFLQKYGGGRMITITPESMTKLKKYAWPGNVREMENTIHSTLGNEGADYLELIDQGKSLKEIVEMVEKKIINEALARFGYNQSKTADFLKINRRLLYTRQKDWS
jgi:transcriptional regulator with PAS, ATPase and Fis domain